MKARLVNNKFLIIITTIVFFLIWRYFEKEEKLVVDKIFQNSNYSVGTLTFYSLRKGKQSTWIRFMFEVKNKTLQGIYDEGFYKIPAGGLKVGDKYLVIYSKDDPQEESIMLFDHPIKDTEDFENKLKNIEAGRIVLKPQYLREEK